MRPILLLIPAIALVSATASADNGAFADALFQDARRAAKDGNYAEACPKFRESQRLDPSAGTRLNIAICEEHEHRIAAAWASFRAVVDELLPTDPRAALASEHIAVLTSRLPRLTIRLPASVTDVGVIVDGTMLGVASIGTPLPVDPGSHTVEFRQGERSSRVEVTLSEGEIQELVADLPASRPVLAAASRLEDAAPSPRSDRNGQRTLAWAVGLSGAAAIAASLLLGGFALDEAGTVARRCPNKECDAAGLAAARAGARYVTAANVTAGLGVLAMGGGITLFVTAPSPVRSAPSGAAAILFGGVF